VDSHRALTLLRALPKCLKPFRASASLADKQAVLAVLCQLEAGSLVPPRDCTFFSADCGRGETRAWIVSEPTWMSLVIGSTAFMVSGSGKPAVKKVCWDHCDSERTGFHGLSFHGLVAVYLFAAVVNASCPHVRVSCSLEGPESGMDSVARVFADAVVLRVLAPPDKAGAPAKRRRISSPSADLLKQFEESLQTHFHAGTLRQQAAVWSALLHSAPLPDLSSDCVDELSGTLCEWLSAWGVSDAALLAHLRLWETLLPCTVKN